jgi:hypothetical protein
MIFEYYQTNCQSLLAAALASSGIHVRVTGSWIGAKLTAVPKIVGADGAAPATAVAALCERRNWRHWRSLLQ